MAGQAVHLHPERRRARSGRHRTKHRRDSIHLVSSRSKHVDGTTRKVGARPQQHNQPQQDGFPLPLLSKPSSCNHQNLTTSQAENTLTNSHRPPCLLIELGLQRGAHLVRMSHTRHTLSRPPVMSTSSVGCSASEYTPLRWPW